MLDDLCLAKFLSTRLRIPVAYVLLQLRRSPLVWSQQVGRQEQQIGHCRIVQNLQCCECELLYKDSVMLLAVPQCFRSHLLCLVGQVEPWSFSLHQALRLRVQRIRFTCSE